MNKGKKAIQLIEGAICRIMSLGKKTEPIVTQGVFRGYTIVGDGEGICIEMDNSHKKLKGKIRVIPTIMVLSIDILTDQDAEDEEDTTARYMG